MLNTVRNIVDSRINEDSSQNEVEEDDDDMLSKIVQDRATVDFLTPEFITQLLFSFSFVTQSVSPLLAFAVKFLTENPAVMPELIVSRLDCFCVCVYFCGGVVLM